MKNRTSLSKKLALIARAEAILLRLRLRDLRRPAAVAWTPGWTPGWGAPGPGAAAGPIPVRMCTLANFKRAYWPGV